ncbi:hypothetical protein GJ496_004927 [Pomphorhynchus laevis]|nr:hypothetical protein GJ496_004927 [Pomphorhynchus laevis]
MEIVNSKSHLISDYEVLSLLQEKDPKLEHKSFNLWINLEKYLQERQCANQSSDNIKSFKSAIYNAYPSLTKMECFQLVNLCPRDVVERHARKNKT